MARIIDSLQNLPTDDEQHAWYQVKVTRRSTQATEVEWEGKQPAATKVYAEQVAQDPDVTEVLFTRTTPKGGEVGVRVANRIRRAAAYTSFYVFDEYPDEKGVPARPLAGPFISQAEALQVMNDVSYNFQFPWGPETVSGDLFIGDEEWLPKVDAAKTGSRKQAAEQVTVNIYLNEAGDFRPFNPDTAMLRPPFPVYVDRASSVSEVLENAWEASNSASGNSQLPWYARSMSVGDVAEVFGRYFAVASVGFEEVYKDEVLKASASKRKVAASDQQETVWYVTGYIIGYENDAQPSEDEPFTLMMGYHDGQQDRQAGNSPQFTNADLIAAETDPDFDAGEFFDRVEAVMKKRAANNRSNSMKREADILEAMRFASLDEQRQLMSELDSLRAARKAAAAQSREVSLADAVIRDTLTPVFTKSMHTVATDWMDEVAEDDEDKSDDEKEKADKEAALEMAAQASVWFKRLSAEVVADREEFAEQARGKARQLTSSYGLRREAAVQAFLDAAAHLRKKKVAVSSRKKSLKREGVQVIEWTEVEGGLSAEVDDFDYFANIWTNGDSFEWEAGYLHMTDEGTATSLEDAERQVDDSLMAFENANYYENDMFLESSRKRRRSSAARLRSRVAKDEDEFMGGEDDYIMDAHEDRYFRLVGPQEMSEGEEAYWNSKGGSKRAAKSRWYEEGYERGKGDAEFGVTPEDAPAPLSGEWAGESIPEIFGSWEEATDEAMDDYEEGYYDGLSATGSRKTAALSVQDLLNAVNRPDHMGWGYRDAIKTLEWMTAPTNFERDSDLAERGETHSFPPFTMQDVHQAVIDQANRLGLDEEELFLWANSKDARHFGDELTYHPTDLSGLVARYLNKKIISELVESAEGSLYEGKRRPRSAKRVAIRQQSVSSTNLPPGAYVVGDPCYAVADDEWMPWLESANYRTNDLLDAMTPSGYRVTALSTEFGDGTYPGSDGFSYGVDAGLIGVVPLEYAEASGNGTWRHASSVHNFSGPFTVARDEDGTIYIDSLTIETGDIYDEDYDDEDGYYYSSRRKTATSSVRSIHGGKRRRSAARKVANTAFWTKSMTADGRAAYRLEINADGKYFGTFHIQEGRSSGGSWSSDADGGSQSFAVFYELPDNGIDMYPTLQEAKAAVAREIADAQTAGAIPPITISGSRKQAMPSQFSQEFLQGRADAILDELDRIEFERMNRTSPDEVEYDDYRERELNYQLEDYSTQLDRYFPDRFASRRKQAMPSDDLMDVELDDYMGGEGGPSPDSQSGHAETALPYAGDDMTPAFRETGWTGSRRTAREKMDPYFAVFNSHINNAAEKADQKFIETYGQGAFDIIMKPLHDAGIMSIFQNKPTDELRAWVGWVTEFVNGAEQLELFSRKNRSSRVAYIAPGWEGQYYFEMGDEDDEDDDYGEYQEGGEFTKTFGDLEAHVMYAEDMYGKGAWYYEINRVNPNGEWEELFNGWNDDDGETFRRAEEAARAAERHVGRIAATARKRAGRKAIRRNASMKAFDVAETLPAHEADAVMAAPFIAQDYHSGQFSAMYALSSSGTMVEGLAVEAREAAQIAEEQGEYEEAETLSILADVAERMGL